MGSWDMINKRKLGLLGLLCLLAFFWSYSFSTRIGLFFLLVMVVLLQGPGRVYMI